MNISHLLPASFVAFILYVRSLVFPVTPSAPTQPSTPPPPFQSATPSHLSQNWAGFIAQNGTYTGISAMWKVPTIKPDTGFAADATWIGIGGVNTDDLIQAGTQTSVSPSGRVDYEAFYEVLPDVSQPLMMLIHPGDTISVALSQRQDGQWQIAIKDVTTNDNAKIAVNYNSSLSSAEWIEEAPAGLTNRLPLDNFGEIQFSNATTVKNGEHISLAKANADAVNMAGSEEVLARASVIGEDGKSFLVSRTQDTASLPPVNIPIPPFLRGYHLYHSSTDW